MALWVSKSIKVMVMVYVELCYCIVKTPRYVLGPNFFGSDQGGKNLWYGTIRSAPGIYTIILRLGLNSLATFVLNWKTLAFLTSNLLSKLLCNHV